MYICFFDIQTISFVIISLLLSLVVISIDCYYYNMQVLGQKKKNVLTH